MDCFGSKMDFFKKKLIQFFAATPLMQLNTKVGKDVEDQLWMVGIICDNQFYSDSCYIMHCA